MKKILLEKLAIPPNMNTPCTKHELTYVHFPALEAMCIPVLQTTPKWYFLTLEEVSVTGVLKLRRTVNFVL